MRRKSEVLSRGLTFAIAFSMIMTSSPVYTVLAEDDNVYDDTVYEESFEQDDVVYEEPQNVEEPEAVAPIFIVKNFKDFEQQDGKYINPETLEKYGKLKAKVATPLRELGLPKDLTLVGYWEADASEAIQEMELKDISWELDEEKYGEWAVYDEYAVADTYTFVPDLDDYVLNKDGIDGIELAEGVKMLRLDVEVYEEEAVVTDEAVILGEDVVVSSADDSDALDVTEAADATDVSDGSNDDIFSALDAMAITDNPDAADVSDGEMVVPDAISDLSSDDEVVPIEGDDDIFASLDNAVLSPSITEEDIPATAKEAVPDIDLKPGEILVVEDAAEGYEEDGEIVAYDADVIPVEEAVPTEGTAPAEEAVPTEGTAPAEETVPTEETAPAEEAVPTEETAPAEEPTPTPTPTPAPTPVPELTGILGLTDGKVTSNDNKTSTLIPGGYENEVTLNSIACNMNLASVTLLMDDKPLMTELNLTADQTTINMDGYVLVLTVMQNSHAWDGLVCKNCGAVRECEHVPAGEATCIENDYCKICYQELPGTALGHDWIPPTCKTAKSCKRCGTISGNKLGHVPGDDATCTQNATCDRCGAEIPGTALGHDWKKATCTAPKTCKVCGATEGKKLGHDLGDWVVIQNSTDTTHGIQRAYCQRKNCEYYQEARLNIVGNPAANAILGIRNGDDFAQNTRITFTAYGAGMANNEPLSGDVRYLPSTWSIQGMPGSFTNGYEGAFSIAQNGSYTVLVTYQKQRYDGEKWLSTETADSKSVTFTIGNSSAEGANNAIHINPQTGDDTPIIPIVIALVLALAGIVATVIYRRKR